MLVVLLVGGATLAPGYAARSEAQAPATSPALVAALAAIPQATEVRIRHGWSGYSPVAPIDHSYELTRMGRTFRARAVCRARREQMAFRPRPVQAAAVQPSLARLSGVTVTIGRYVPRRTHTDDRPRLSLELDTPAGLVAFASQSQGEHAVPWSLAAGGESGVIESPVPSEVMEALVALLGPRRCAEWTSELARRPPPPQRRGLVGDRLTGRRLTTD